MDMSEISKEFLIREFWRWVKDHNGKIPGRDEILVSDGYPSAYQYMKMFNTRKWNDILRELGAKPHNEIWTEEQIQFVKDNYIDFSDIEIAQKLNKTQDGVRSQRHKFELFRTLKKQFWQLWEIDYLKENFYDTSQEEIEIVLNHRKWATIRDYATKRLKLIRARFSIDENLIENNNEYNFERNETYKNPWTEQEKNYIILNWNKQSDEEMAIYLNRVTYALKKQRQVMGLFRENNPKSSANNKEKNFISLSHDKKYRTCKICKTKYPNSEEYFYKDKTTLKTICKKCQLDIEKNSRINNGAIVRDIKEIMLNKGLYFCGSCKQWLPKEDFFISLNNEEVSRWCNSCRKKHFYENYIKNTYNISVEEYEKVYGKIKLVDLNGDRCDSFPEVVITNYFIEHNIEYIKHPRYNRHIKNDNTRRSFDWIIFNNNKQKMFVEYFGMWGLGSNIERYYTKKAKKKIKDLYNYGYGDICIFIFPCDLKNKTLDEIFMLYINNIKVSS